MAVALYLCRGAIRLLIVAAHRGPLAECCLCPSARLRACRAAMLIVAVARECSCSTVHRYFAELVGPMQESMLYVIPHRR
jgi:hypothetical protein